MTAPAVPARPSSRCACPCGCDYRLDGYAPHEYRCGACVDVCTEVTA